VSKRSPAAEDAPRLRPGEADRTRTAQPRGRFQRPAGL